LSSSASKSPALLAYIAALNNVDAVALLSTGKVRARLDPAITAKKGIERHHLFPRAYLRKQKVAGTKQINQIANMALVEWHDNIAISDHPPSLYSPLFRCPVCGATRDARAGHNRSGAVHAGGLLRRRHLRRVLGDPPPAAVDNRGVAACPPTSDLHELGGPGLGDARARRTLLAQYVVPAEYCVRAGRRRSRVVATILVHCHGVLRVHLALVTAR